MEVTETARVWEKLYQFAKKGAPQNEEKALILDESVDKEVFQLIRLAVTHHRDKVNDVLYEIEKLKIEHPEWSNSPKLVSFLNLLTNICKRTD